MDHVKSSIQGLTDVRFYFIFGNLVLFPDDFHSGYFHFQ
jgi:hypothetical protein